MAPSLAHALLENIDEAHADASPDLEATVARLVEDAKAAWPAVHVDPLRFLRYVSERLPRGEDCSSAVASLHFAGLYLACACADGSPAGLAAFDVLFAGCEPALARLGHEPGFADEVKQQVRTKLFVKEPNSAPKITEYSGRGDLRRFVRVIVMREAISQRRSRKRAVAREDEQGRQPESWLSADPELLHLRKEYEAEFQRVFGEAVRALTSQDRNLLRYHYLDGLNIDHIGAIYGIHRVSAARRLTKVREQLVQKTRQLLAERLRLHTGELESVLRLIESDVDISLRRVLGDVSAQV